MNVALESSIDPSGSASIVSASAINDRSGDGPGARRSGAARGNHGTGGACTPVPLTTAPFRRDLAERASPERQPIRLIDAASVTRVERRKCIERNFESNGSRAMMPVAKKADLIFKNPISAQDPSRLNTHNSAHNPHLISRLTTHPSQLEWSLRRPSFPMEKSGR